MTFHITSEQMHPESPWTEGRIEVLTEHWKNGLSCSQIAAILGNGITRNAVIGKAHRIKLHRLFPRAPRGPKKARIPKAKSAPRKRAVPRHHTPEFPVAPPPQVGAWEALPGSNPIGLMELSDTTCRWPIGDDRPFKFCGCAPAPGSSYCPTHKAMASHPVTPKSQRKLVRMHPDGAFRRLGLRVLEEA